MSAPITSNRHPFGPPIKISPFCEQSPYFSHHIFQLKPLTIQPAIRPPGPPSRSAGLPIFCSSFNNRDLSRPSAALAAHTQVLSFESRPWVLFNGLLKQTDVVSLNWSIGQPKSTNINQNQPMWTSINQYQPISVSTTAFSPLEVKLAVLLGRR